MKLDLPKEFVTNINEKLGDEALLLMDALKLPAYLSKRYNLAKSKNLNINRAVPWCQHATYLEERPVFTLDPLFHAGAYYVQEPSSMILFHILNQLVLSPKDELTILDLCAAPGGKSTIILDYLKGEGCLISNEVINSRTLALKDNIIKWGFNNCIVTNNDARVFGKHTIDLFDIIVIDAPCSGEGMFRKDPNAACEWSLDHVKLCKERQQRILSDVIPALKEGGLIIYSTCTFNDIENIDFVEWAAKSYKLSTIPVAMPDEWGISKVCKNDSIGYHFYPHKVEGEGLFIAVLQKSESDKKQKRETKSPLKNLDKIQSHALNTWVENINSNTLITQSGDAYYYNKPTLVLIHHFLNHFKVKYSGIKLGHFNKNIFIPHHALALANNINVEVEHIDLTLDDAQNYLRKQLPKINVNNKGWMKVTYQGLGIGWLKNLGNRINNYLPKEIRIRNL